MHLYSGRFPLLERPAGGVIGTRLLNLPATKQDKALLAWLPHAASTS